MKKEHGDGLFRLLAPSVAGLLACVVCLCATSWAWFSASVTAATTIRSASYTVSVTVQQGETPVAVTEEAGVHSVKFLTDGEYTITLTPASENTAKGYCLVAYNGVTYYTDQLTTGSLSFTVTAATETTLTITPTWGTYTGSELKPLAALSLPTNDPVVTDQTEDDANTVEPADESKDEGQEQPPDQPDETGQSGENKDSSGDSNDQNSGDPAEGDTPAGGEPPAGGESGTGTETGDSGNPAPASDASESATESTQETPSDQTAFRFPTDWNGLSS